MIFAMLAGCASMSADECRLAHWDEQGWRDGRDGMPVTRIIEHRKACAEVGVVPDADLYRQGHERGVMEYCTPARAVSQGRAGRAYQHVCPPQLEDSFIHYHRLGMQVYDADTHLKNLERESAQLQRELKKEKDAAKQRHLRDKLRELDRRERQARRDLTDAERRLSRY